MFFLSIFLLKFLMTLARAICVCYGAARGHTTYGLEMRTWNNEGFSGSSTSVYDSSVVWVKYHAKFGFMILPSITMEEAFQLYSFHCASHNKRQQRAKLWQKWMKTNGFELERGFYARTTVRQGSTPGFSICEDWSNSKLEWAGVQDCLREFCKWWWNLLVMLQYTNGKTLLTSIYLSKSH